MSYVRFLTPQRTRAVKIQLHWLYLERKFTLQWMQQGMEMEMSKQKSSRGSWCSRLMAMITYSHHGQKSIQQSAGVNIFHAADFKQKSCSKKNSPSKWLGCILHMWKYLLWPVTVVCLPFLPALKSLNLYYWGLKANHSRYMLQTEILQRHKGQPDSEFLSIKFYFINAVYDSHGLWIKSRSSRSNFTGKTNKKIPKVNRLCKNLII